jgi:acyl-CoA synthetase (NDP forming)
LEYLPDSRIAESDLMHEFHSLFNPRSVAVVGASVTFAKWGQLILSNILAGGFKGKVFPINPKEKEMYGLPAFHRIEDVPEQIDLAFVTTPAETVPSVLEACGRKGVKGVVVITSGFSETDQAGKELETKIVTLCRERGLLLIGPNTMGIICPHADLFATGTHARPRKGSVAFISQSGNLGNQLIHWAEQQGIGVSLFVGSGNDAMLSCTDYLDYLEGDIKTDVILLYLESVGDGRRFLSLARRINRRKPVILLKGGRTEAGRSAAASHTGSMSGEVAVFRAACRQAGLLEARVPSELLDLSAAFSSLPLPRGNRVGIVTLGGGWGVVTADECNEKGLTVPPIPAQVVSTIGEYLPPFWSKGNPVDLVGTRNLDVPVVAVEQLLRCEHIDAVISLGIVGRHELVRLLVQSAQQVGAAESDRLNEIEAASRGYEESYIKKMVELMETYEKPVIGVSMARTDKGTVRAVPGKRYSGVFYQTPESAVNVLAWMVAYRRHILHLRSSL